MKRVLFVEDGTVASPVRCQMPARELVKLGWTADSRIFSQVNVKDLADYDVVVGQRPVGKLDEVIGFCRAKGVRLVVDFDDDFISIPKDHPGYNLIGRGNPQAITNMLANVVSADLLIVSTPVLANRFSMVKPAEKIQVIENAWDDSNPFWKEAASRETVNVGWCGSLTHREDVKLIAPVLSRIAQECPEVKIVIGADPEVYRMLGKVAESQKVFIPGLPFEEYPYLLRQFDILLAPVRDNPFNEAKSDIKQVEAGALGVPYVVSDVEPYRHWPQGAGFLAKTEADWYRSIKSLVEDPGLRSVMGLQGRLAAESRRASVMGHRWAEVLEAICQ